MYEDIRDNLKRIRDEIGPVNNLGEEISILGATKFVSVDRVNAAIDFGLKDLGENKAQEFRDKFDFYLPVKKHFIGTLQSNKLKYVVGKADIVDSVSSEDLAVAIDARAKSLSTIQDVMIEINGGDEASKTGANLNGAKSIFDRISSLKSLRLVGVMAMLPVSDDESLLADACERIRSFYDEIRKTAPSVETLSIGMSGDYKIAVKHGSNQVRLGRAIFGER